MKKRMVFVALALAFPFTASGQIGDEKFQPSISVEQAAITARRAIVLNQFNPKSFEIHSTKYRKKLIPDEVTENLDLEKGEVLDGVLSQIKALRRDFGNGPGWEVRFWRTKRVSNTGNWYDDIEFGLIVFVYAGNKAAVLDYRSAKDPSDKIKPNK